jgi:hypothetical protein
MVETAKKKKGRNQEKYQKEPRKIVQHRRSNRFMLEAFSSKKSA